MNNMVEKLTIKFIEAINNILEAIDLESIDDILDDRDADGFSSLWMKAWQNVEKKDLNIDKQREEIFKLIFSKTQSSDLAAYITEDFELIARHLDEKENTWVANLCGTYFDHQLPRTEFKNKEIKLVELIDQ